MAINNTVENINNQPTIEPRTVTGIFTKYIAKTLPLAFDESMSYYECLCALLEYLNDTIVPDINNTNDGLSELQTFYLELQSYVNNYFDNLDVQEEINNKLDKMTESGELTELIKNYVDPIYQEYEKSINEEINNFESGVNERISTINTKVNNATSGSPLVASSISGMTDTSRIYVNTTDGHWYWYDGDSWEDGGVYQATGIADEVITANKLSDNVRETTNIIFPEFSLIDGYYRNTSSITPQNGFAYTSPIELKKDEILKFKCSGSGYNVSVLSIVNSENEYISLIHQSSDNSIKNWEYKAIEDVYVSICYLKSNGLNDLIIYKKPIDEIIVVNLNGTTIKKYINSGGAEVDFVNNNYSVTGFIEIVPNIEYTLENFNWVASDVAGYAFYNENHQFVEYKQNTPMETLKFKTTKPNAKYVRLTVLTPTIQNLKLYIAKTIPDTIEVLNDRINSIEVQDKNYDFSSFIKFGVIGDSLASGEAVARVNGQNTFVDNYDFSWGQYLARQHGMTCVNFSNGGLTTRSWLGATNGLTKLQLPENKCNAYIIGLGVNDYTLGSSYIGSSNDIHVDDYTQNADTFYGNYGKIISHIKLIQPKAKIFILTIPDQTEDSIIRNYTNWNTAIRTIATLFDNVYVIDLASDYNSYYNSGFMLNNLRQGHYNAIGYNYISELMFKWISDYMRDNYTQFSQIEFIGTDYQW